MPDFQATRARHHRLLSPPLPLPRLAPSSSGPSRDSDTKSSSFAPPLISGGPLHFPTIPLPTSLTAGADWDAQDAVHLLHSDPRTPGRTGEAIASPPAFSSTIAGDVDVESGGEIRLAATQSAALTVLGSLTLAGGSLSGRGRIDVEGSTSVVASGASSDSGVGVGEASSLKNGVTLDMYGGGVWSGGGLHARDGASVVNRGQLSISADGGTWFGRGEEQTAVPTSDKTLWLVLSLGRLPTT